MRRTTWAVWAAALLAGGCASQPVVVVDSPEFVPPGGIVAEQTNPMLVYLGATPEMYRKVFECAVSTLTDFGFAIAESNAHDGRIETLPRVAPGILQPLSPGAASLYERVLSTFQCYRHRAQVLIEPSPDNNGYFVRVTVFKELEDLPSPTRATTGGAIFRTDNDVERKFEVIDPTRFESHWLPRGRDLPVEHQILARMRRCL
jgi:hypothetical protein